MSTTLSRRLVRGCLHIARLPSLPPPVVAPETHLVSHEPVRPLARLDVTPDDFPFADRIRYYREGQPNWVSLLRA